MGWMKRRSSSEIYTRATTHGVTGNDNPTRASPGQYAGVGSSRKEAHWFQRRATQTPK